MGRRLLRTKTRLHPDERTQYSDHLQLLMDFQVMVRFAAAYMHAAPCSGCSFGDCLACQAATVVAKATRGISK